MRVCLYSHQHQQAGLASFINRLMQSGSNLTNHLSQSASYLYSNVHTPAQSLYTSLFWKTILHKVFLISLYFQYELFYQQWHVGYSVKNRTHTEHRAIRDDVCPQWFHQHTHNLVSSQKHILVTNQIQIQFSKDKCLSETDDDPPARCTDKHPTRAVTGKL